jgi:hypothetical protein
MKADKIMAGALITEIVIKETMVVIEEGGALIVTIEEAMIIVEVADLIEAGAEVVEVTGVVIISMKNRK